MSKRYLAFLITLNSSLCLYAMEYSDAVFASKQVKNCFDNSSGFSIIIKKRLCFHLFAQAALNKDFCPKAFSKILDTISQETQNDENVRVSIFHTMQFRQLFTYIPWNGKTDTQMGYTYHEVTLNQRFVNLGFSKDLQNSTISVIANNEDDFDCQIDHREKIENAFKTLLISKKHEERQ